MIENILDSPLELYRPEPPSNEVITPEEILSNYDEDFSKSEWNDYSDFSNFSNWTNA